eukprot:CAMPEP_0172495652 /NCGR_PEP_ID=MMETSP1066-20121228/73988_1 /TAXON_ID=671091 /ORGANISM="Coscinodiscus wailesii, Strain CCMP2513" /LENGTH=226 /DNA_ID=CAMNT_0013267469 /DNA_START=55 /DNA_END=732 /DNA_ORIENTATION=+
MNHSIILVTIILSVLQISRTLAESNPESRAFLEENGQKDGVIKHPSGLQYKILRKGDGKYHPAVDSPCEVHYHGTLIDGTVFDSSYERGSTTTFAPNQVIKGWTTALQMMVVGDMWEIYVPSNLGYGDRGSPPKIPGGAVLIFKMEIIKIKGDTVPAIICDPVTEDGCNEKEVEYIEKMKHRFKHDMQLMRKESDRIKSIRGTMSDTKRDKDKIEWADRRVNILEK